MSRCIWRSALVLLILSFDLAVMASVPAPVDINAAISDLPRGGQILVIKVTSVSLHLHRGAIQVRISGDFLDATEITKIITLTTGEVASIRLPIVTKIAGELSNVVVRVLRNDDTAPVAVEEFFVGGVAGDAHMVTHAEAEQFIASRAARDVEARANALAEEQVRAMLARGDAPAPNPGDPAAMSVIERAWNETVQRLAPNNASGHIQSNCYVLNTPSYRNYYWASMPGYMTYEDNYPNFNVRQPDYGGHTVSIETPVEYTDGCGNYMIRTVDYSASTSSGGSFAFQNVYSLYQPSNPVIYLRVTFSKTGTFDSPTSMSPGNLTLYTNDVPMTSGNLRPHFSSSNAPNRFYFRWNDEAMYLEGQWASLGFYVTLRSAYDSTYYANAGCYCQTSPGLPIYGSQNLWSPKWVAAHEMGHQWDLQRSGGGITGQSVHTICGQSDSGTAFHEGFADWAASWFEPEGRTDYMQVYFGELQPCAFPGYNLEGNVAAYLWDIFDDVNSSSYDNNQDTMSKPLSILGNWAAYNDFPGFYNGWTTNGVWGADAAVADTLRTVNTVVNP